MRELTDFARNKGITTFGGNERNLPESFFVVRIKSVSSSHGFDDNPLFKDHLSWKTTFP